VRDELRLQGAPPSQAYRVRALLSAELERRGGDIDPASALRGAQEAGGARADDGDNDGGADELDDARLEALAALALSDAPDALAALEQALTPEERAAFQHDLASGGNGSEGALHGDGAPESAWEGSVGAITALAGAEWEPWWVASPAAHARAEASASSPRRRMVHELLGDPGADGSAADGSEEAGGAGTGAAPPPAPVCVGRCDANTGTPSLPPFAALSRGAQTSPLLPCLAVDILYAYAHTARAFGGQHSARPVDAAGTLLAVSTVLGGDARHATPVGAATAAMAAAQRASSHSAPLLPAFDVLHDVAVLLAHAHYVADALADVRRVLAAALAATRSGGSVSRARLMAAFRKAEYYASWARDYVDVGVSGAAHVPRAVAARDGPASATGGDAAAAAAATAVATAAAALSSAHLDLLSLCEEHAALLLEAEGGGARVPGGRRPGVAGGGALVQEL
jgi:hypothetical protein